VIVRVANQPKPRAEARPSVPEPPKFLEAIDLPQFPPPAAEPAWGNGFAKHNSQLGDSPMMRNWKLVSLHTLLAGVLAAAPTNAADTDGVTDLPGIAKQLKEVKESLKSIKDTLNQDILSRKDQATQTDLKIQKAQSEIKDLRTQIEQLQRDVVALSASPSRVSGYPANGVTPAAAGLGRLRLVNNFAAPMTIAVNRMTYPLAPGETRIIEAVPAGKFTYEVLGVQPPQERTLAVAETFTVTVFPRFQ
jgi:hypothetical protein